MKNRIQLRLLSYLILLVLGCSFTTQANEAGTCRVDELLDCQSQFPSTALKSGWQFGVGVASVTNVPIYIGAEETRSVIVPVPYITYTSEKLKIGQGGIVGRLFDSEKWLLSVSLSGAIPVNSDKTEARRGMADIDAIFEFGPSLKYYLWGRENSPDAAFFDLNIRQSRTIKLRNLKFTSSPAVVIRKQLATYWFGGKVNIRGRLGWELVSDDYASEFYSVPDNAVTAERTAFHAQGGYAGYRANTSIRWQSGPHIVSSFLALADIGGAQYVASPLVKTKRHFYGGMVYFYLFE